MRLIIFLFPFMCISQVEEGYVDRGVDTVVCGDPYRETVHRADGFILTLNFVDCIYYRWVMREGYFILHGTDELRHGRHWVLKLERSSALY